MRIAILTVGSRGDVQPFIALGRALKLAGHDVLIATHVTFEQPIRELDIEFSPLAGDMRDILQSNSVQDVLASGGNPFTFIPKFIKASKPLVKETVKEMLVACENMELVILAGLGFYGGADVAEKLDILSVTAVVQPMHPTRIFQNPFFPAPPKWLPFKGIYNRFTHMFFGFLFWQLVRPLLNEARKDILDLSPATRQPVFKQVDNRQMLSLGGISPAVIPKPKDWAEWHKMTGYWFLDAPSKWQPPEDLLAFLDAGEPPIYIGFGSMSDEDTESLTEIVRQSLKRVKCRGILLTGWGAISATKESEDIYIANSVPHDWLFPKVAAVVHHGGAGTTAAGFRAGVPTIIVPFMGDQFFWAHQAEKLGVGATPGPRKKLTANKLSQAIQTVLTDESIRMRAKKLGESIRKENGTKQAIKEIEDYIIRYKKNRS